MSNNTRTRIENQGFTEQYDELDHGNDQQQCSWIDGDDSACGLNSKEEKQFVETDMNEDEEGEEEDLGPSYADRVEEFLEKVFGGITSDTNNDNNSDRKL